MIAVAFISDRGALYLPDCIDSFLTYAPEAQALKVIDDSDHLLGMAGAVRAAWDWALELGADYLFHVEEDFRFTAPVPLAEMVYILDLCPYLAQTVLKRQPWSNEEKAYGGQIEYSSSLGNVYTQRHGCTGIDWVAHSTLFSMNPSLIPRRTLELAWSTQHPGGVERAITEACKNAAMYFAYYGKKDDPPRCEHVGHVRASTGWRW